MSRSMKKTFGKACMIGKLQALVDNWQEEDRLPRTQKSEDPMIP